MFADEPAPRLFGLPPGAEFPRALMAGLDARLAGQPAEAAGRVEIFVNTRRMARRLRAIWAEGPARVAPRLRLVTDLGASETGGDVAVSPLRRRLELAQLVTALLHRDPTLAARAAAWDLADGLAALMDEMQGEGVAPDALRRLDVGGLSRHWDRSLRFIALLEGYFAAEADHGAEARQRRAVDATIARWAAAPPADPVIVAGSTGSRGTTARFMAAVAQLPQGAVVLPGFDFDLPASVWARLDDPLLSEDHPQYRFARLLAAVGAAPGDVRPWSAAQVPQARNKVVSLALRPAPVTDQWRAEGGALPDLVDATARLTLIEAPSTRREAAAIALVLRQAVEDGRVAALITPDRGLTRQVAAALDRWGIVPDDSAGRPLPLTPPGRFLRHVAAAMTTPVTAQAMMPLLKHPLCHSGRDRGPHRRHTWALESWLRRKGPAVLGAADLAGWAGAADVDPAWAAWLCDTVLAPPPPPEAPLADLVTHHIALAGRLADGPNGGGPDGEAACRDAAVDDAAAVDWTADPTDGDAATADWRPGPARAGATPGDGPPTAGGLWDAAAGRRAADAVAALRREAPHGGRVALADYPALFDGVLNGAEPVRDPDAGRSDVMIWGTLEARVQGADLVVLGGLNDGTWPELPAADPWLNRAMRREAGLLLPDRRIGLAAHDFQQAVAAPEAVLTRAVRDAEAQTVVSRWVNRLTNLLRGLPERRGDAALAAMRARGAVWLDRAAALDERVDVAARAARPSPRPPVAQRPTQLSVTKIQTLIRDPYAVYADRVLGLRALDPLRQAPDARLRGTVLHAVFARFLDAGGTDPGTLTAIADEVLARHVAWPAARSLWRARLARVADWFVAGEALRRAAGTPVLLEARGAYAVPGTGFTLTGQPDRIDRLHDGRFAIYDYKTGAPPGKSEIAAFDRQLLLEAVMAEAGAFPGVDRAEVAQVAYIGLGSDPVVVVLPLRDAAADDPLDPDAVALELRRLIAGYGDPAQGYTSRRAMQKARFAGDFDHLARFGEWSEADAPAPVDVGRRGGGPDDAAGLDTGATDRGGLDDVTDAGGGAHGRGD